MTEATASERELTPAGPQEPRKGPVLSGPQEVALLAILSGLTLTDAGEAAGVTRQTVAFWLREDPDFLAEYHARRAELWAAVRHRLECRVLRATDVIDRLMGGLRWQAQAAGARLALDYGRALFSPTPPPSPHGPGEEPPRL